MYRDTDWDIIAIFVFLILIIGGIITGVILSEYNSSQTAKECIRAGFEWIDDSCIRK